MRNSATASAIIIAGTVLITIVACVPPTIVNEATGETSSKVTAGPCAGQAIDVAVKCATAKGATILSYYRDPADQQRVRKENGCTDVCHGQAGCVRPTADCTTSPHTACKAVDLNGDGAPLTADDLQACGLAKTTAPHANHYDLVGAPTSSQTTTTPPTGGDTPTTTTPPTSGDPNTQPPPPTSSSSGGDATPPDPNDPNDPNTTTTPGSGTCNREGGLYCGNPNTALGGDPNTLYECSGGAMQEIEECTAGCQVNGVGIDDQCLDNPDDPSDPGEDE